MEARLGARLLERTTRRMQLTEVGQRTYDHVRLMIAEAEAAREAVDVLTASPRGLLRVTAPVLLGRTALPSIVTRYLDEYRDVAVALEWTTRNLDPVDDDVDVVIRVGTPSHSRAWIDTLFQSRPGIYVSPSFRGKIPKSPRDYTQHEIFAVTRGPPSQTLIFKRRDEVVSIPVSLRLRTNDIHSVIEAAENCGGCALLPDFAAPPDWKLTCEGWQMASSQIITLTTRHGRKLPRVAAFIEAVKSGIGNRSSEPYS